MAISGNGIVASTANMGWQTGQDFGSFLRSNSRPVTSTMVPPNTGLFQGPSPEYARNMVIPSGGWIRVSPGSLEVIDGTAILGGAFGVTVPRQDWLGSIPFYDVSPSTVLQPRVRLTSDTLPYFTRAGILADNEQTRTAAKRGDEASAKDAPRFRGVRERLSDAARAAADSLRETRDTLVDSKRDVTSTIRWTVGGIVIVAVIVGAIYFAGKVR